MGNNEKLYAKKQRKINGNVQVCHSQKLAKISSSLSNRAAAALHLTMEACA